MIFLSIFLILVFKTGNGLLTDGDTGYHIRAGEYIVEHLAVPKQDIFSFLSPQFRWTVHEWLSEVIMAVIHSAFGLTGVVVFFSFLLALTHFILYKALRAYSDDIILVTALTSLATATSSSHWLARPHLFSLMLTLVWYRLLNDYQYKGKNTLFYLPALMLVWVNLHGGFIIGLLLVGIYLGGNLIEWTTEQPSSANPGREKAKQLLVIGLLCLATCLVNPQGFKILLFPFEITSNRFLMDNVAEFLSPNFHQALPFKYMLLAAVAIFAISRIPLNPIELALLLLMTYMSLYSVRYVSLFAIMVSYPLLRVSESLVRRLPPRLFTWYQKRNENLAIMESRMIASLWPALGISLVIVLSATGAVRFQFAETVFPVAAVNFIKEEKISGNMFSNDEFGDYIIYAAWPEYRVFMDGRSDMYGEKVIKEYLKIARVEPGWEDIIRKHDITTIMFNTKSALSAALMEHKDWHPIYADKLATIFIKNDEDHNSLIRRYGNITLPQQRDGDQE